MLKTFSVENVKYINEIKMKLEEFKDIKIILHAIPQRIDITIEEKEVPLIKDKLSKIGYPIIEDKDNKKEELRILIDSYFSHILNKKI